MLMEKLDPRRALEVQRYHTWPHLRPQSVGEHSIQVMRVVLAIWPDAPRHLLVHCMTHDVGELRAGDPPYPSKVKSPEYAKAHSEIEKAAHREMCIPWQLPAAAPLTDEEALVFKTAEIVEWSEWAICERNMGNKYADIVLMRGVDALRDRYKQLSEEHRKNLFTYWRRRCAAEEVPIYELG